MDDRLFAQKILELVGSQDNVEKSWYCATSLRIIPNDAAEINFEELRATVILAAIAAIVTFVVQLFMKIEEPKQAAVSE